MRLINTSTLKLEEFIGTRPRYAILSHTWTDQEVSFQEFTSENPLVYKSGYTKIVESCRLARSNDPPYDYIWVDTCCIDKSSSAELSEAINSMYQWYSNASICYAYLADVAADSKDLLEDFQKSRWFTRGWTLQELIAPWYVNFYTKEWKLLGSRLDLAAQIEVITSIDITILVGIIPGHYSTDTRAELQDFSVAKRMSWAARRTTTRPEDLAYCLMGIFNINMPLLYGEGERAFLRLQEEIVRVINDQSILAWWKPLTSDYVSWQSFFAPHPRYFEPTMEVSPLSTRRLPMLLDSRGLSLEVDVLNPDRKDGGFAVLDGYLHGNFFCLPAIAIEPVPELGEGVYSRIMIPDLYLFTSREIDIPPTKSTHLKLSVSDPSITARFRRQRITLHQVDPYDWMSVKIRERISPPLTFVIEQDASTPSPYEVMLSVPHLSSSMSVTQRARDFHPSLCPDIKQKGYTLCLCGAFYFGNPAETGFFIYWGVRVQQDYILRPGGPRMARPGWWDDMPPFVFFGGEKPPYDRGRSRLIECTALERLAYLRTVGFNELIEAGRSRASHSCSMVLATTATRGNVHVTAVIDPVTGLLNRKGYHLTVKFTDGSKINADVADSDFIPMVLD